MELLVTKRYILVVLSVLLLTHIDDASKVIAEENSIQNLKVDDVSEMEMRIMVDYYYNGERGASDIYVFTNVLQADGKAIPGIVEDVSDADVNVGRGSATSALRKETLTGTFKSTKIEVCISHRFSGNILCKVFPFDKVWGTGVVSTPTEPAARPEIISFVVSKTPISKGDSVTLSWQTSNANLVTLNGRKVEVSGSEVISPERTTTYVLFAGNIKTATHGPTPIEGGVSKNLEVQVSALPNISRFSASPATIRRSVQCTLTWDVYNADQVTLDGVSVPARGNKTVTPKRTTVYLLKAWTQQKIVEERVKVSVSPYAPPKLSSIFKTVELCKKVDGSAGAYSCISPDGPFWMGNEIYVIARFKDLPKGRHKVTRTIYDSGLFGSDKWKRIHQEESGFSSPKTGYTEITFKIPGLGKGVRKLELVIDDRQNTKSDISYCIECPGHDEW